MSAWRKLVPERISGQIALLIVAALASVHVILTALFLLRSDERRERPPVHPGQIEMLAALLNATPAGGRGRTPTAIAPRFPDLALTLEPPGTPARPLSSTEPVPSGPRLPPDIERRRDDGPDGGRRLAIRLDDGEVLTAHLPRPPGWRRLDPLLITVLSLAIITIMLGVWAARAITAPLRDFARAAESYTPEAQIEPLPERGPEEVRSATRAFNAMRERIKTLVEDRTRMLVAVGHDLRTPITRLRLSSEFIPDAQLRGQMLRDLDQMNAMIESVLTFMREGRTTQQPLRVDLDAMLQTICDEFADAGHDVTFVSVGHVAIEARPDALRRAVANLLDNAIHHAGRAIVRLTSNSDSVTIAVEDDGPGIPDDAKAAMLEPFVRGEAARHMDENTGFGLGLPIAAAVALGHGGTLTLRDRQPSGLIVEIALPLTTTAPAA